MKRKTPRRISVSVCGEWKWWKDDKGFSVRIFYHYPREKAPDSEAQEPFRGHGLREQG